jgi:hypothetical protein
MFSNLRANFGTMMSMCVNPILQLLICHFMLVIVVHAFGTTEWHRDGSKAKGMKNVRIFAILIACCALLFNASRLYLTLAHGGIGVSMQMIYVLVLAVALLVVECCMSSLPVEKKKVVKVGKVHSIGDESVDGEVSAEEAKMKRATPIGPNALAQEAYKQALRERWIARATGTPGEQAEPVKPLKKPSDEKDVLELGEDKKVKCPHCGNIVWAQAGAPAYICPECGEKFCFKA